MSKKKAPVSVVIPCFCCVDSMERSVYSVVNQTMLPEEVWLVDDASSDAGETLKKLYELKEKYAEKLRIEVIAFKENHGPSVARNAGWDKATQPYIAFLDADDSWHPKKIEIQYLWIKSMPEIDVLGHQTSVEVNINEGIGVTKVEIISEYELLIRGPFSTSSVMLRKNIECRFMENKRYCEDYDLWLRVYYCGGRLGKINATLDLKSNNFLTAHGLSSNLWKMEKGELGCYFSLWKNRTISLFRFACCACWSMARFCKRVFMKTYKVLLHG